MIECAPIGSGFESVGETPTRRYWAHRNTWDAVRPFAILLIETMPMHGSTFGRAIDGIVHGDLDGVSPIGFNQRLEIEHLAVEHVGKIRMLTPGYWPLIKSIDFEYPSGLTVPLAIVKSYERITPVSGLPV